MYTITKEDQVKELTNRVPPIINIDLVIFQKNKNDDYEEAKPSPHAYQTALQKLSLKAGECLAVEDSPRGATSSVSAGVTCYVIPTPLTDISLCPPGCNVLNNLKQLVELVPIWGAD